MKYSQHCSNVLHINGVISFILIYLSATALSAVRDGIRKFLRIIHKTLKRRSSAVHISQPFVSLRLMFTFIIESSDRSSVSYHSATARRCCFPKSKDLYLNCLGKHNYTRRCSIVPIECVISREPPPTR